MGDIKLNVFGQMFGSSGYDIHTRNLVNAIYKNGLHDIHLEVPLPNDQWPRYCNDDEFAMIRNNKYYEDGINMAITLPSSWRLYKNQLCKKFVGFCVWEGDKIPPYWVKFINEADLVFVPSEHVRNAIENTCNSNLNTDILIVPHGVNKNIYYPEKDLKNDGIFTFIANKGWSQGMRDRGGIQWIIQAFGEEFTSKEKVRLLVKINPVYNNPNWNVFNEIKKVPIVNKDKAPINVNFDLINEVELRKMYNMSNCFINASMADGFNMPCLEAMACGLPVLTTTFGGMSDFCTFDTGWLMENGELFEVKDDVLYEGIKWMKPNINRMKQSMRYCFDNQDEVKQKGKVALEVSKDWSWDNSARKAISGFKKL